MSGLPGLFNFGPAELIFIILLPAGLFFLLQKK